MATSQPDDGTTGKQTTVHLTCNAHFEEGQREQRLTITSDDISKMVGANGLVQKVTLNPPRGVAVTVLGEDGRAADEHHDIPAQYHVSAGAGHVEPMISSYHHNGGHDGSAEVHFSTGMSAKASGQMALETKLLASKYNTSDGKTDGVLEVTPKNGDESVYAVPKQGEMLADGSGVGKPKPCAVLCSSNPEILASSKSAMINGVDHHVMTKSGFESAKETLSNAANPNWNSDFEPPKGDVTLVMTRTGGIDAAAIHAIHTSITVASGDGDYMEKNGPKIVASSSSGGGGPVKLEDEFPGMTGGVEIQPLDDSKPAESD